ncbi:vWA domain-containing protein [Rhodospirillum sp. A1_3_36]|uniref:vWA domain-containing protein n=1 Tax=Rhodospirillum sp. A1_3_36 TaxID=3391666 RepID=UPI0039A5DD3F
MKKSLALLCLLLSCAQGMVFPALAQERHPLLIEGKKELYQRVLSRPGAKLTGAAAGVAEELEAFTPLYVYSRRGDGGVPALLEVGSDTKGTVLGYLPEKDTVEWNHALVLAFSQPIGRGRTLFFSQSKDLEEWEDAPDGAARAEAVRQAVDAGTLDPKSPVIAIEPSEYVDFEKNFYMLPVLSADRRRLPSGFRVRNVEVAGVTLAEDQDTREQNKPLKRRMNKSMADFRAGVVFIIDSSSSMGPYINRTREVVSRVLKRIEGEGLGDKVRFGLVAYRDDPTKVKGIEYLTRTFADPNVTTDAATFQNFVAPLEATEVSTRAFAEDAFSAIDTALNDIDWSGFSARYLILVTDASARGAREETVDGRVVPPSATGLDVTSVNQLIRSKKAALYTFHLKTPQGKADHDRAEAQYRILSRYENAPSLYYPVEAGDEAAFANGVETLTEALVEQMREAEAINSPAPPPPEAPPEPPSNGVDLVKSARMIGRAMALAHLGRLEGASGPTMFRAWASDRDFTNPDTATFTVRVLLSKNQLSDLQKTLQLTVEALERGQIDPDNFFDQLRSAALSAGRDPSRVGQGTARNMEEAGLVSEYLEGLPYQSRLMSLTEDDWLAMGVGEQQAIIDESYSKIRLYQKFHDDSDRWIALNKGAEPGDMVYPVPIDMLP